MTCADCKNYGECIDNFKIMDFDKYAPTWAGKLDNIIVVATYMEYTAYQSGYNFHVMIFDEVAEMVCHVPCDKIRSEDELVDMIKIYMIAAKQLEKIWEDDEDD